MYIDEKKVFRNLMNYIISIDYTINLIVSYYTYNTSCIILSIIL